MICLADNDIISKLATSDLLDEALVAFGVAHSDVFVLPAAVHVLLRPSKPGKGKFKPDGIEYRRLAAFFERVNVVNTVPSAEEQFAFNDAMGIDPGEAILFSATAEHPDFLLATGDKKWPRRTRVVEG